jgi:glucose/arabinose dehydrogenase
MKAAVIIFFLALVSARAEVIDSSSHRLRVETIADGLDHPWAVAQLPDGRFLVTERRGRLLLIDKPGTAPREVAGVPAVVARGQGGLLDVALHPGYAENGWIYLAYSKPVGEGSLTAIARGKLQDDRLTELEMIFDPPSDQATGSGSHFGCRMAFDGRGRIFFSIGDRGGPTNADNLAQSLASVTGKIHRLHDDGRVPADNPFVSRKDAMPSIWAYGSRNAQGLVYDTGSGRLWETEHGPRGGDELNIIRKGANYGWPLAGYGINYSGTTITKNKSLPGMEDPVVQWTPVIAASGLALYRGDKFPRWRGNLFAGGLASEKLVRLELSGATVTEQEIVLQDTGRIRDVRSFDDGFLYVVYDEPGKVVRLVPAD